jgi:hypothetical protein
MRRVNRKILFGLIFVNTSSGCFLCRLGIRYLDHAASEALANLAPRAKRIDIPWLGWFAAATAWHMVTLENHETQLGKMRIVDRLPNRLAALMRDR